MNEICRSDRAAVAFDGRFRVFSKSYKALAVLIRVRDAWHCNCVVESQFDDGGE